MLGKTTFKFILHLLIHLQAKHLRIRFITFYYQLVLTREVLDAVIDNLTEGPKATNNDSGQIIARAESLSPSGISIKTDTSERNHQINILP